MERTLFFTGVASTPNTVGVMELPSKTILEEINVSMSSGRQTRKIYNKTRNLLNEKYGLV